jgi:uncharacterized membrane protein
VARAYTLHSSAARRRRAGTARLAAAAIVAAVLVGGYQGHWSWTGISGKTATLWDWISLLLLPLTVATLPVWLSRRHELGARWKTIAGVLVAVFVGIALAGYLVPWNWTGFEGNALWDWINLLLLPLVVATFPLWPEIRKDLRLHHHLLLVLLLAAFLVSVVGGYVWGWSWTGFQGNTLWDWLHLLLLPLVIPTLLIPAAVAITAGELLQDEPDAASITH